MDTRRDWHEDDRFWELAEPMMFDDLRIQSALPEVEQILRLTRLAPGSKVLDLCCGPGRHAIELARKGFCVTGVDRTARYLDRARRSSAGLDVEWVREDARQFVRPDAFDLAINLYTSFGYFEDPADDLLLLRNVAKSLRPGGTLVMQMHGKEIIAKRFAERTWGEHGDLVWLQEHRLLPNFSAIEDRWTLLTPKGKQEIGFVVRLYAASELAVLLEKAGFAKARFLGSLEGVPYDHNAQRMVAVAQSPDA